MRKREKKDEDSHPERWLVSFADFMTLMFALFVVLFASAFHDKKAIQRVSAAVKNGFQEMGTFSVSESELTQWPNDASKAESSFNSTRKTIPNAMPNAAGIDVVELHR